MYVQYSPQPSGASRSSDGEDSRRHSRGDGHRRAALPPAARAASPVHRHGAGGVRPVTGQALRRGVCLATPGRRPGRGARARRPGARAAARLRRRVFESSVRRGGAGRVTPATFAVSAQCHRVNVVDGHLAAVRVKLDRAAEPEELREAWASFSGLPQALRLPTAPERPIIVRDEPDRPQPRLDRDAGRGMSVTVGRIARDSVLGHRFVALSHNTIRGAAGAAILNAELLLAKGYLEGP